MLRNSKGITLIVLVITIVVLLILAGISLSFVLGNEGILKRATNAADKTDEAAVLEEIQMTILELQVENLNQVTLETLAGGQLASKLEGITANLRNNVLIGEYKNYNYKIDENFKITINTSKEEIKLDYKLNPEGYTNGIK